MQGYTIRVAEAINNADGNLVGVQLGRLCLKHDIPVVKIAGYLGVTRQTVYAWFVGKSEPKPYYFKAVQKMIREIKEASN
jgi:DNA-binding transcriptional regulator YiaG